MSDVTDIAERAAVDLYWYCVDFVIHVANLSGLTYRDVNALLFGVIWPLVTVGLVVAVVYQSRVLRGLRERGGGVD